MKTGFGCGIVRIAGFASLLMTIDGRAGTSEPSDCSRGEIRDDGRTLQMLHKKELRDVEGAIERLRNKLEEWGIVTASLPIVMTSQGQFKVDNSAADFFTPKEYIAYQQTNVSGTSLQSTETAVTNQFSGSAKGQFQLNPTTGQVEPILGPATDLDMSKLNAPSSFSLTGPLSADRFAAPGSLASGLSKISGNSGRAAVLLGMNDKLTERIMAVSANPPTETFVNKDYQVFFAIVEVSCNPGWRTRENYIADLSADCEYYNAKTCSVMPDRERKSPMVFSVLPLLDAQNLELGNSARQLSAMAAQLSAAYPTIGFSLLGQDLITFVHRYQKDSITRTPVTVTNSYSNGRTFGFRFAPSFTAQADPAYRKSKSANILNPTAFPVLVTVITKPSIFGGGVYDSVRVNITTQWLIKDRPALPVWYKRLYTPLKRDTIAMRTAWAGDIATLNHFVDATELPSGAALDDDPVLNTIRSRARVLASKCGPQNTIIPVVPDKKPGPTGETTIRSFIPSEVPKSDAFSMVLSGPNLGRATKVILGGKPAATISVLGKKKSNGEDSILVTFPPGNIGAMENNFVDLRVITDVDIAFSEKGNLPLLAKADRPKEGPKESDGIVSIAVQRDTTGSITGIKLDRDKFPSLNEQQVIDFFTKIIEQDKRTIVVPSGTATPGVNVNTK